MILALDAIPRADMRKILRYMGIPAAEEVFRLPCDMRGSNGGSATTVVRGEFVCDLFCS